MTSAIKIDKPYEIAFSIFHVGKQYKKTVLQSRYIRSRVGAGAALFSCHEAGGASLLYNVAFAGATSRCYGSSLWKK
jgi:hypothetical protein